MDGDTIHCKNCSQDIPEMSFMVHEARCARYNYRCVECNKTFQLIIYNTKIALS